MHTYFTASQTSLLPSTLSALRRRLAAALKKRELNLITLSGAAMAERASREARGCPLILVDDSHADAGDSPAMRKLVAACADLRPERCPRVIYVTRLPTAASRAAMADHPLVRACVARDDRGHWVDQAVSEVLKLVGPAGTEPVTVPRTGASAKAAGRSSALQRGVAGSGDEVEIAGASPLFLEACEEITRLFRWPVMLVTGEHGTGKITITRTLWQIHRPGTRFVVMACGMFYKDCIVGAARRKISVGPLQARQFHQYMMEASKGALLLHHVDQLPLNWQHEIVACLDSRSEKSPAGSLVGVDSDGLAVSDATIIATATEDPDALVRRGHLIPELARVFTRRQVRLPSLSERGRGDVRLLSQAILRHAARVQYGSEAKELTLDKEAAEFIEGRTWPGNTLELKRVLEYACRQTRDGPIQIKHLPPDLAAPAKTRVARLDAVVADAQRRAIRSAIAECSGDIPKAAKLLGRNTHALYRLMRKLGMKIKPSDM